MTEPVMLATACDREPIHVPGSIQPHGLLLVAEVGSQVVRHVAGDVEGRLGAPDAPGSVLGSTLASCIGPDAAGRVAALAASGLLSGFVGQVRAADGAALDASAFLSGTPRGAWACVELEPPSPEAAPALVVLGQLETAAAAFGRAASLRTLCEGAAEAFRQLTGFDRVMIYRFGEDGAGSVLAEARRDGMRAFLNHHFPASDIPQQARALYVRNLTRAIPDAAYRPVPLRPAWTGAEPLDMSDSSLRSVSPIHLEYLRNMGVRASASISVVREGALWGLVACHHETPRCLPYDVRAACRVLAGVLGRQIRAREEADGYRHRIRFRSMEDDVVRLLSREGALDDALGNHLDQLCRVLDADGVAVVRGTELVAGGIHPQPDQVRALAAWLLARPGDAPGDAPANAVFATAHLAAAYPPGNAFQAAGSGVLALTLSAKEPWMLLWFRAEEVEVLEWAGNPHKAVGAGPDTTLTPRASFEAWRETVRGRSRRWTAAEAEAAHRLRGTLLDMRQNRRMKELNRQLTQTLQDKNQLIEQKDYLIGEVNHRVQNSLQLVSSFLQMQARSFDSPDLRAALEEARRRLAAVALVHRRLYAGEELRQVEAARYVEELCADTVAAMGREWAVQLSLDLSPVLIPTDRAVTLGLVLTELFINVNKYAYGGAPGPIEVQLSGERGWLKLVVADRGTGRVSGRRGFGSRMIDGLVAQFGGQIAYEDNAPGLRAVLTAPNGGGPGE